MNSDIVLTKLSAWQAELRKQFPILRSGLAYLDSAATAQKPRAVLDAVATHLSTAHANVGRGVYPWSTTTAALVERVREQVKQFLHDPDPQTSAVHFTSGTSEGLRRIALDWLVEVLDDGDEIIVPFADHMANLDPWLEARDRLAERRRRIVVHQMPYDAPGDYDLDALRDLLTDRTRFIAVTHVHHVYGVDMNIARIRAVVGPKVVLCLDAAQSIGHHLVSLADLDVDFLVFSGHKAMALTGIGAVWAANRRGPALVPSGWTGTPNIVGTVSLGAALDWLTSAGLDMIEEWVAALGARLTDGLSELPNIELIGGQCMCNIDSPIQRGNSIVTFRHAHIPAGDLGFVLADMGLMVRADHLCQAGRDRADSSIRASLHVYNTPNEIDRLLEAVAV